MKRLSKYACDRSLTHIRERASKAPRIHFSFKKKDLQREDKRPEQVAFSAVVGRLLSLARMSEAISRLPPRQSRSWDTTFSSTFDNMQVFLSREKAELSLNIPQLR